MPRENKILKLIAGVNTKKEVKSLFSYFKENEIEIPREYISTLLNKYYMLPDEDSDSDN
jgi:hypothetical protein